MNLHVDVIFFLKLKLTVTYIFSFICLHNSLVNLTMYSMPRKPRNLKGEDNLNKITH